MCVYIMAAVQCVDWWVGLLGPFDSPRNCLPIITQQHSLQGTYGTHNSFEQVKTAFKKCETASIFFPFRFSLDVKPLLPANYLNLIRKKKKGGGGVQKSTIQ